MKYLAVLLLVGCAQWEKGATATLEFLFNPPEVEDKVYRAYLHDKACMDKISFCATHNQRDSISPLQRLKDNQYCLHDLPKECPEFD